MALAKLSFRQAIPMVRPITSRFSNTQAKTCKKPWKAGNYSRFFY